MATSNNKGKIGNASSQGYLDALAPGGGSGFPGGGKAVVEDKVETVEGERHMRIRGFVWMGHFTLSSGGGSFFQ